MSKAEEFIESYTRNCSNEIDQLGADIAAFSEYYPWLTPDQARRAVEIARKEMFEKVCKFLGNNLCCYIKAQDFAIEHQRLENDLKQAMKDLELTWVDTKDEFLSEFLARTLEKKLGMGRMCESDKEACNIAYTPDQHQPDTPRYPYFEAYKEGYLSAMSIAEDILVKMFNEYDNLTKD